MATMRFQQAAKDTPSSGQSWEGFIPKETKAQVVARAEDLVRAISGGHLGRPLLSEVASFLHYPA